MSNDKEAEDLAIVTVAVLAMVCTSIGIGVLFGAGYGWLILGLAFALIFVLGMWGGRGKRK
jgi:hypothetical protein